MKHPMTLAAVFAIFALVLGACAPQVPATPTLSLADMQATAMAQAAAMLTQTALAQPTATLAPTATPEPILPEPTEPPVVEAPIVEVPAVEAPVVLVPDTTASDNICNQSVSKGVEGGKWYSARIVNNSTGYVDLYGYMYQTVFGCGFVQAHLAAGEAVRLSAPKGCYDFYGWQTGAKPSTPAGYGCLDGPATITITNDAVNVVTVP